MYKKDLTLNDQQRLICHKTEPCLFVRAGSRFMFTICFYRALKLQFPLDVEGLSSDARVTIELGTGSLRHAIGIFTPNNFQTIVDTE